MAYLQLQGIEKFFGDHRAIKGIDLTIEQGEFMVFVGPSGCGKSTLLRLIAGLERIDRGQLHLEQRDITHLASSQRDLAMVFQSYALYPHMSVYENMSFALKLAHVDPSVIRQKVQRAADILNLGPYLKRTPRELSGGQRQRVAIGRAIVREPKVFLFDEPLSNLDAKLRVAMRAEIKALHQRLKTTTVYVTHDQIEAMTMADRIVVMHDGIVEQIGTPLELFDRPSNLFVAQFIGSPAMNVFKGAVQGGAVHALGAQWAMPANVTSATQGQQVYFGIRPSDLNLASSGISAKVVVVEPTGAETELLLQIGEQSLTLVMHGRTDVKPDDTVYLQFDANKAHVFDATNEQRL
jgi:multiple sugar transport system ATP-binding protein